ncbi:MAG: hypothetical protein K0S39_5008 [Paenibacillus sp.]|nr:hypothetical protein [Paenibacillus sp.]
MTKSIQAYFRTENEAEDVRILLQKYDTDMLEVGPIEDGTNLERGVYVPLAAGISTNGTGNSGTGAAGAVSDANTGLAPLAGFASLDNDEDHDLHYVLSVQVNDADYNEIVHLIRSNQGHVARPD